MKSNSVIARKPETAIPKKPGTTLANYPDGPSFFPEAMKMYESSDGSDAADSIFMHGPALSQEEMKALPHGTPLVVKDQYGRVMMANGDMTGAFNWAYLGKYKNYPKDMRGVMFNSDGISFLQTSLAGKNKSLFSNGPNEWEWAFWGDESYNNSHTRVNATLEWYDRSFRLFYNNGKANLYLTANGNDWDWAHWEDNLKNEKSDPPLMLTAHQHFYMSTKFIKSIMSATLPSSWTDKLKFYPSDPYYCLLSNAEALSIWRDSPLPKLTYKPEKFDCDDFAFVYKGFCSLRAHDDKSKDYGFATGFIWGIGTDSGHALNLFVSYQGEVVLLEPQNGRLYYPRNWTYEPYLCCL